MTWDAIAAISSSVVAAVALYALLVEARRFRQDVSEQVYLEYTRRYGEILNGLPPSFFRTAKDARIQLTDENKNAVHRYVDLCSEEVKLKLRNKIPDIVWKDWEAGIRSGLQSDLLREVWKEMKWHEEYAVLRAFVKGGLDPARQAYERPASVPSFELPDGSGQS